MRASDQFHVGIVVDDFEATLATLTEVFGYEWCDELALSTRVSLPDGDVTVDLGFTYSMTTPRLEIVRSRPGTIWEPAAGSGVHHVGYWSDDVAADSALLENRGFGREATGFGPDDLPMWTYHRSATGPRIELVTSSVRPLMEQWWQTGKLSV